MQKIKNRITRFSAICIGIILLILFLVIGILATTIPSKVESKSNITVLSNNKATVDTSNLSEGYIMVKYTGKKDVRIKLQIIKKDGSTYTYNLNNQGEYETFPLVEGDGTYDIRIYENISGTKYATVLSQSLDLTLRNEFLPFLYPNQFVNYHKASAVSEKAAQLCKTKDTSLSKLDAIYDYVVNNLTYDYDKAKTVKSGYLPDVDAILDCKTGICFDYAAVMTAMLRSQDIPCKLVVGYAGTIYHAWINVFIEGTGWIDHAIYFDGTSWKRMDPTFASSADSSDEILQYIGNGKNYSQKYVY